MWSLPTGPISVVVDVVVIPFPVGLPELAPQAAHPPGFPSIGGARDLVESKTTFLRRLMGRRLTRLPVSRRQFRQPAA